MVLHRSVQTERGDMIITTTLCGRSNRLSDDIFNSTEKNNDVTCKFCIQIQNNVKHWRFRKYLDKE